MSTLVEKRSLDMVPVKDERSLIAASWEPSSMMTLAERLYMDGERYT